MKKTFAIIGVATSIFACTLCYADEKGKQEDAVTYITGVISSGNALIDKARKEQDVTMMNCVNAQLINAKGFLNVAQSSTNNIADAKNRGDSATVEHNERLVTLAVSKVREIDMKMKQCASGVVKFTGDTTLQSTRSCKFEPCETDNALIPSSNEGNDLYEQQLINASLPNVASPFI